MKIAIISDIHGNLAAVEAFPEKSFDHLWCLGDLVDYGPRPHQVIQWVRHHATPWSAETMIKRWDSMSIRNVPPPTNISHPRPCDTRGPTCTQSDFEFLRNQPVQKEDFGRGNEVLSGPCGAYRSSIRLPFASIAPLGERGSMGQC